MRLGKLLCATSMTAAVCGLAPGAATAGTVYVTATGTLDSGFDQLGEFGAVGGDMTGYSYKAVYSFNVPSPYTSTDGSNYNYEDTEPYYDGNPSLGSVTVTINSISESYDGSYFAQLYKSVGPPYDNELYSGNGSMYSGLGSCQDYPYVCNLEYTESFIYNYGGQSFGGLSLTQPGSYSPQSGDVNEIDWAHYIYSSDNGYSVDAYDSGTLSNITVGGAVPEPAGWGLMLVGFGGLGAVLRRRRALVAA